MTIKPSLYYTCCGSVRGYCGVHHRSIEAAGRCCAQDARDVRRGHGGGAYSDRAPVAVEGGVEGGVERGLTDDEDDRAMAAREGGAL